MYITIEKGEFERGGKSTGKNIEVTVLVLDEEGQLIDVSDRAMHILTYKVGGSV